MDNRQKAMNILRALEDSTVAISWHRFDDGELVRVIETTLNQLEGKEKAPAETAISDAGAFQNTSKLRISEEVRDVNENIIRV